MKCFLGIILGIYLAVSSMMLLVGFVEGNVSLQKQNEFGWMETKPMCLKRLSRIVKVLPTFKLGCWLGSSPYSQYFYKEELDNSLADLKEKP
jgi:hypothetical protein